jgi:hypothetical protein
MTKNHRGDTEYLLSSQNNAASLAESVAQYKRRKTTEPLYAPRELSAGFRSKGQPPCFSLPANRGEFFSVEDRLDDWVSLLDMGSLSEEQEKNMLLNSVIHVIECALILWLSPYASMRGIDSDIFRDINELSHHCYSPLFQRGYPLEMIEALSVCYSIEKPWALSQKSAREYGADLLSRLKDLALYSAEELEPLRIELSKHRSGRKKGALSEHKKFVRQFVSNNLQDASKVLWGQLLKSLKIDDEKCPLWSDGTSIFRRDNSVEYTFARFEKDVSEFRNSPLKIKNSSLP